MNAALDVHYTANTAAVACVGFRGWEDGRPVRSELHRLPVPERYVPGRFFLRELPCLLHALQRAPDRFRILLIDGFVHLKPPLEKGLGAHLAGALRYPAAVIGVAKNPFPMADRFVPVFRGRSRRPLFVSSVNLPLDRAVRAVQAMHGEHRIPTMLRIADRLSRET